MARKGRGSGAPFGISPGLRPVTEDVRIRISGLLEDFQRSSDTEFKFEEDFNNHDRAVVHAECRKYGFTSKSHGKGTARKVTVYKSSSGVGPEEQDIYNLPISAESEQVLQAYFRAYPATPAELAALEPDAKPAPTAMSGLEVPPAGNLKSAQQERGKSGRAKGAASFDAAEVARRRGAWEQRQQTSQAGTMAQSRARLPISAHKQEIMDAVADNQVVMVAGNTGCGKSTQVPQYILEDAWGKGRGCRVLCAQPRRISAVSIAERVASERGETIGQDIGYSIRLESKGGPQSSLMFCTNGVLLRALTHGEGLGSITHVVVDEVHERDKFADFLLIQLRQLLPAHPRLRLILMSATLHIDLFANYFGGCPVVEVPGFMHPVRDVYLDDILGMVGYPGDSSGGSSRPGRSSRASKGSQAAAIAPEAREGVEDAIMQAFLNGSDADFEVLLEVTGAAGMHDIGSAAPGINITHPSTGATALMAAAGKGRFDDVTTLLANGADASARSRDGGSAADWAMRFGHSDIAEYLQQHAREVERAEAGALSAAALSGYQAATDADEVDLHLTVALLQRLCSHPELSLQTSGPGSAALGAILVFLPGWDEISRLKDLLEDGSSFAGGQCLVLPLHSMVPSADQRKVFKRPALGVRKIVLATNIAETAVTIDDVVCVINSGRLKEKSYDPYTAVGTLQSGWISRASERQRRGRAGRCQPGVCYHLYSRARSEALAEFQMPELQRCPLEELCLQVKLLEGKGIDTGGSIGSFLGLAPEPPMEVAITRAVALLESIGALQADGSEQLTTLGRHLAALPLAPKTGKLLLYGCLHACLDPLLTVACAAAFREPWVLPVDARERAAATAVRAGMARSMGGSSDQLAVVAAFEGWSAASRAGKEWAYAKANYLSSATMHMIAGMRSQLLNELQSRGFVANLQAASLRARDLGVVRCVLACGMYPLLGRVLPSGGKAGARNPATIVTSKGDKARIHFASVNANLMAPERSRMRGQQPSQCPLVTYEEATRSEGRLMVRECTAISAHALSLVAAQAQTVERCEPDGDWDAEASEHLLLVDEWLLLQVASSGALACLMLMRQRLGAAFAAQVHEPQARLPQALDAAVEAICQLYRFEAGPTPTSLTRPGAQAMQSSISNRRPNHLSGDEPYSYAGRGRSQQSRGRGRGPAARGPAPGRQPYPAGRSRGRGRGRGLS